jgi:hypothetical protein
MSSKEDSLNFWARQPAGSLVVVGHWKDGRKAGLVAFPPSLEEAAKAFAETYNQGSEKADISLKQKHEDGAYYPL